MVICNWRAFECLAFIPHIAARYVITLPIVYIHRRGTRFERIIRWLDRLSPNSLFFTLRL